MSTIWNGPDDMQLPQGTEEDRSAREVCLLVLEGELQDLEDGELAELATIGIYSVEEGLATIQESKGSLQTVSCTGSRRHWTSWKHLACPG